MVKLDQKILDHVSTYFKSNYEISVLGGMTNTNYLITLENGKKYVLKVFGKGTNQLINRKAAKSNIYLAKKLEIDVPLLKYDIDNGIAITEYIENSITLNSEQVKNSSNMKIIASTIYKLHSSDIKFENKFSVFDELRKYESLVNDDNMLNLLPNYTNNRKYIVELEKLLATLNPKKLPCHNDLVAENFLRQNDRLYLIDWEYSGINDPAFDFAALFLENNFNEEEIKEFLSYYPIDSSEDDKTKIYLFMVGQDVLWAVWSIFKYQCGIDYLQYGIDRYNRGIKNLKCYFSSIF